MIKTIKVIRRVIEDDKYVIYSNNNRYTTTYNIYSKLWYDTYKVRIMFGKIKKIYD